ncbi:MAG TPA: DUF4147 domain-containing protein, partial [Gemmatimonadales bacterium]|nr:DUF4147 domain-containing protein [Gemmatimonadales bacterium]
DAADPVAATAAALRGGVGSGRVIVVGWGKAAIGMAAGAVEALGGLPGVVATPTPGRAPPGIEVIAGEHPIPGPGSISGGHRLLEVAAAAGEGDTVLALISGGGSACSEVPAPGLSLDDLAATTEALLRSGAPITEINTVRRHLSGLKGGRLARVALPARVVTLILSDVAAGGFEDVAGGPTVPDPTTPAEALGVLADRGLLSRVPDVVAAHLRSAPLPDRTGPWGPVRVVADGARAAEAARRTAADRSVPVRIITTKLTGEASEVGAKLASPGVASGPGLLIAAGETTVAVSGTGRGGRNQELALAAGIALERHERVVVAALGTDGVDGPTPAAGGIGDAGTVMRGRRAGLDARAALGNHDSHGYLEAVGDTLYTGPTGTNVGDVVVVLTRPR